MKEIYQKQHVKVVEIQVEKGFATSGSFSRNDSDAMLFNMLLDQPSRNEQWLTITTRGSFGTLVPFFTRNQF